MKIKVDKEFTVACEVESVKADIKEFKGRYTDGDLRRAFLDAIDLDPVYGQEIISVTGEAWRAYTYAPTMFRFVILATNNLDSMLGFCKMTFFCDMDLKIDTEERPCPLFEVTIYSERQ